MGLVVYEHRQPLLVESYGVVDVVLGAKELCRDYIMLMG